MDVYSSVEVGSDLGVHQIFGRPSQSGSAFTVIHVNITSVHCIVGSDPGVHQIFGRPSQSGSAFTVIHVNICPSGCVRNKPGYSSYPSI